MSKSQHKRTCIQSKCVVREELLNQLEQREKEIKGQKKYEEILKSNAINLNYENNIKKKEIEQLQQSNKLKDNVIEAYKNADKVRSPLNVHNLYEALKEMRNDF